MPLNLLHIHSFKEMFRVLSRLYFKFVQWHCFQKFVTSLVQTMYSSKILNTENGKLFSDTQVSKFVCASVPIFTSWKCCKVSLLLARFVLSSVISTELCFAWPFVCLNCFLPVYCIILNAIWLVWLCLGFAVCLAILLSNYVQIVRIFVNFVTPVLRELKNSNQKAPIEMHSKYKHMCYVLFRSLEKWVTKTQDNKGCT